VTLQNLDGLATLWVECNSPQSQTNYLMIGLCAGILLVVVAIVVIIFVTPLRNHVMPYRDRKYAIGVAIS